MAAGDVLQLVVTPEHDPLGTPVETWTEQDIVAVNGPAFSARTSLFDMGSGRFTIPRSVWENSSINARRTYYVRAYVPYIDSDPIFGIWLLSGAFILASSDEIGGETVTVGGPGPMHYLKFAILPYQPWDSANAEVQDGTWYFEDQSHGEVMARLINQDGDSDYPALAALTSSSFGVSTDTDGNAWPDNNGIIALQRGINYFDALRELQRSGSLDAWMTANLNLRMFGSPEYGRDLTGLAYGAGVVRFAGSGLGPSSSEPKNILDDLTRNRDGGGGVTHCLAVGRDKVRDGKIIEGQPIHHWYVRADFDPLTDAIKQGYLEYDTNNLNILERAARRYMRLTHERAGQMADFAIAPGQDESTGLYLPGPPGSTRGNFWFGDTVTVKTGGSGNDLDFTDADIRVAAIRMDLDEAASDKNATEKQRSWQIAVELGDDDPSGGSGGNGELAAGNGNGICRCSVSPAPDFEPDPGDSVAKFYNANDVGGDAESWTGNLANQAGGANGTSFYNFKSSAPNSWQTTWAASAGSTYRIEGYVNTSSAGQLKFGFFSAAPGAAGTSGLTTTLTEAAHVISPPQPNSGNTWVLFSAGPFTAPVGTNSAALGRTSGVSWDELTIYLVADPVANDEEAVDYNGYPHDSPFFLPSDYVEARLDELAANAVHLIDDLDDVDTVTTPPADGDVLTWVDADEEWEPLAPSAGSSLDVQEDTASIVATAAALDFVGADFDVTDEGSDVAGVGIAAPSAITPTQLAANTDNWNPTGLASTDVIRASTDASRNLTGIAAPSVARAIVLENVGTNNLVLVHNATSTAANRFFLPSDVNLTMPTDSAVLLVYDTSSTRWRVVGGVGTAGSVDAADVTFTPTSPMVETNVQDAMDELLGLIVLPLTATVGGEGVLVFDENDSLIGVEAY